jgi:hypothetical protein
MSDYSKAVIYKLHNDDMSEIYIGSAKDEIQREQKHKSAWNNENYKGYNYKVYKFIRDNGGWDNWIFKVIERFPCKNKIELVIRERYHYDLLNPALNMRRPYVSEEKMKEYHKISKAKYRETHTEEILKYREDHAEYHKNYSAQHYLDNIEEKKIYQIEYYKDNKEEIDKYRAKYREEHNEVSNQKYKCECGGKYTHKHITEHCKGKKHIAFIKTKL